MEKHEGQKWQSQCLGHNPRGPTSSTSFKKQLGSKLEGKGSKVFVLSISFPLYSGTRGRSEHGCEQL